VRSKVVVYAFTVLLTAALCVRLYTRGRPYFRRPLTVFQHVGPEHHDVDDVVVLCRQVAPMLPRGATVTCFRPIDGVAPLSASEFLTAVGQLPKQHIFPPQNASLISPPQDSPQYVIAIRDPFTHPRYSVVAEFPEGRLYKHQ